MNQTDRLERELTAWFVDTAVPQTPHYVDDILRQTARVRQRPRWTFPERWLPMSVITLGRRTFKPLPLRPIGLLAVLALLIAVAIAVYVGSQQPRLPAPFGLAANGLVAYHNRGDIFTFDPETGVHQALDAGPAVDHDPLYSLDGARLAFFRETDGGNQLVIAHADGTDQVLAKTEPFEYGDISWSPDRRSIALVSPVSGATRIRIIDTTNGEARMLNVEANQDGAVAWRPPDGRQLLFYGGTGADLGLYLMAPDGTDLTPIPIPEGDPTTIRSATFTPDGTSVVFYIIVSESPVFDARTYIIDLETGVDRFVKARYASLSNDGSRVISLNPNATGLQVVPINGGPPVSITGGHPEPYGTDYEWSPDDKSIVTRPASGGPVLLLDPNGGAQEQQSWAAESAGSWQRIAP